MSQEHITVFSLCSGLCRFSPQVLPTISSCAYFPFMPPHLGRSRAIPMCTYYSHGEPPCSPWHFLSPAVVLALLSKLWCYPVLPVSFGLGGTGSGVPGCARLCQRACFHTPAKCHPSEPHHGTGLLPSWTKETEAWHRFFLQ